MGNRKAARPPASKISSAAAVSGATVAGNKSSVLRAAFSPSEYQLSLFASVIQGLDSQHLRIHDVNTGLLQCEHAVAPKESITSLDWGHWHGHREQSKKKRKRNSGVNGDADSEDGGEAVVAFGTSTSEVRLYSPAEDKVIATLAGSHDGGIKDFKFTAGRSSAQGWSIGADNKLVQWDLRTGKSIRIVHVPATSVVAALSRPVLSNPPVICATQTPYIIDLENSDGAVLSLPAMRNPIHTLISSSTKSISSGLFLAADNDRYINVFDPSKTALAMNLVAEKEVSSLSLYPGGESSELEKQVLAVLVQDGTVELFNRPFVQPGGSQSSKAASLKAKGRQMTRKADAVLRIVRPENRRVVSVVKAEFHGPELFVAWAEGGVNVIFERVRWQDEDTEQLAFSGVKEIKGRKSASVLNSAAVNGARDAGKSHVDENGAVVELGAFVDDVDMHDSPDHADVVSISSDEEVSDAEDVAESTTVRSKAKKSDDVEMQDAAESGANDDDNNDDDGEGEEEQEGEELTFGELVQRQAAPTAIDVEAELEDEAAAGPLISGITTTSVYQIPSGVSLSTVLSQALKTNDNDMLESCFHTGDLNIIRTTIQRLDSTLAGTLLQRLAERMASRPGRYGHLLVWVQWTCIAHGGAIAGKADLLNRMSSLFKIMDQRSSSLPSLLLLKGKLDMLDAQVGLRQSMADRRTNGMDDEEMLENVTHYQGVNDDSEAERPGRRKKSTNASRVKSVPEEEDGGEDDTIPNGIGSGLESDNDEEEGSEDEVDDEDLIDIEAEEYAGSSDAEESLEENEDEDEGDEDDSDAGSDLVDFIADSEEGSDDEEITTAPPPKKAKLGKKSADRR